MNLYSAIIIEDTEKGAIFKFCDGILQFSANGIKNFYLLPLGSEIDSNLNIYSPSGENIKIREDGTISNQKDYNNIILLENYMKIRGFILNNLYLEAQKNIEENLKITKDYNIKYFEAVFLNLLSEFYFYKKDYKKAIELAEENFKKFPEI